MSSPEETLDRVIAGYIQAAESGQAPDRAGLLARHPHLADRPAAFFADHDVLNRLARDLGATLPSVDAPPEVPAIRYIGDCELVEEIARGGTPAVRRVDGSVRSGR